MISAISLRASEIITGCFPAKVSKESWPSNVYMQENNNNP